MKIFKKNIKLYLGVSFICFIIVFIILFFYLSSPTTNLINTSETKTFVLNTAKDHSTFNYALDVDIKSALKDVKFYQFNELESIPLKSKVIAFYSIDTKKIPSTKEVKGKVITLYESHIEIFKTVELSEGDLTIFDSDKKLKEIIKTSLEEFKIEIPNNYEIQKTYLHDDGAEANFTSESEANILAMSLSFGGTNDTPIIININQKGEVQKLILFDHISIINKEEINLGLALLDPNFYTRTNINLYGSFTSYLPSSLNELTEAKIIYIPTNDNLLIPFLRLSDRDNTVSITIPVIDPSRIIYK